MSKKEKFFYRFFIKTNSSLDKLTELLHSYETSYVYPLSKNFYEIWVFCQPKELVPLIYRLVTLLAPQSILLGTEIVKPRPIVQNNIFLGIPKDLPHSNIDINNRVKLLILKTQCLNLKQIISFIDKISESFTMKIRRKSPTIVILLALREKIKIYDLLKYGLRILEPYKIPPS